MELASKKLDHKMAELAVKRQKLEVNTDRDREKDKLVAEERQLVSRERMQEKEHQCQREAELHAECMVRMQIQLAQLRGGLQSGQVFGGASNFGGGGQGFDFGLGNMEFGNGFGGASAGNEGEMMLPAP